MALRRAPKFKALVACLLSVSSAFILESCFSYRNLYLMRNSFLKRDTTVDERNEQLVDTETVAENVVHRKQNGSLVKGNDLKAVNNTAWCPNAVCPNSGICRPCDRKFLIIIAAGRSASTTLTYMMDSLPGVRMSGENNNELKALKFMVENVRNNGFFRRGEGKRNPWGHNIIPDGAYACPVQKMIETINPPHMQAVHTMEDDVGTIIGFKTIRFVRDPQETEDKAMVDFVKEMFPCSRIIVNIRSDTESMMISRKKAFHKHAQLDLVEGETRRLKKVAEMFGESAHLLDSTDWLTDISKLNEVVTWLGFDKSCYFTELLQFNLVGGFKNGETKLKLDPRCKQIGYENP